MNYRQVYKQRTLNNNVVWLRVGLLAICNFHGTGYSWSPFTKSKQLILRDTDFMAPKDVLARLRAPSWNFAADHRVSRAPPPPRFARLASFRRAEMASSVDGDGFFILLQAWLFSQGIWSEVFPGGGETEHTIVALAAALWADHSKVTKERKRAHESRKQPKTEGRWKKGLRKRSSYAYLQVNTLH